MLKISEEYLILLILEKNSEALLGTKYLLGENSNSYVTENEHIYRVYNLINDTVLKTFGKGRGR